MSRSAYASRKGSSYNEDRTSRASSGFVEDYSSRPDTARQRVRITLSEDERPKSVAMSVRLPGRISPGCQGRMSAREFLQNTRTEAEHPTIKTTQYDSEGNISNGQSWYVSMLREKEQEIIRMNDEISRFHSIEVRLQQKDDQIADLRHQLTRNAMATTTQENLSDSVIADLRNRIKLLSDEILRMGSFEEESKLKDAKIEELYRRMEALENPVQVLVEEHPALEIILTSNDGRNTTLSDRLDDVASIDSDAKDPYERRVESIRASVRSATADVDALQEEFDIMAPEKLTPEDEVILIKDELVKKSCHVKNLEQQLDQSRKELTLNEGFVHALQRDLQSCQNKIMKLTSKVEKSEAKMNDAIAEAKAMSKKFSDLRESRKHNDIIATNEHELSVTKEALGDAQIRINKMKEKTDKQSKELRDYHRKVRRGNELDKKQSEEIKNLCRDLEDIRRREQLSRVSAEQACSRFERLRSRIIQAVYNTPGAAIPDSLINDTTLFNAVKKIIEDRSMFHQKILETQSDFPPLQIDLDMPPESEKTEDNVVPATGNPERKSGKGGRKSPKHR